MDGKNSESDVYRWFLDMERAHPRNYNLAEAVLDRIKIEADLANLRALRFLLASQYAAHDNFSGAEAIYLDLHNQSPSDPLPLIFLAEMKLYYEDNAKAAMPIIERALDSAFRSGNFRRQALGVKARLALKLKTYSVVADVLNELPEIKFAPGNLDCGIERDFFDRLPAGTVDEELAGKYDQYSRTGE